MLVPVILAAGKGTRMRSRLPKVLHALLGQPLLEHVLETVAAVQELDGKTTHPATAVVVIGHERERIEKTMADADVRWAYQDEQLGTGHAAHVGVEAAAEGEADGTLLILNGDLPLLTSETLHALLESHRSAGAAVSLLTCEIEDPTGYGRVVRAEPTSSGERGVLRGITEEKDADAVTRQIREINVGTYVFELAAFRKYYERIDSNNAQGELYLTDVVARAAEDGCVIATHTVADAREIAQVNDRVELSAAVELMRRQVLEEHMLAGVTIDDPTTTYIERGVTIGADTRILPFTVICRGVSIGEDCEIGPFTHLRTGGRFESGAAIGTFVEIKNTTVGAGSKVRHLSYLGDGDVGQNVNVGAGTIFANYDGNAKHRTVVKDGAFLGSGTVLVAPVTVGARAATGAGSVVLKNQDVCDDDVVAGVPAKPLRRRATAKSEAETPNVDAEAR